MVQTAGSAAEKKSLHAVERETEANRKRREEFLDRIRAIPPERLIYLDMLTVTTIEPAIAFYRDILGFDYAASQDGWACMSSNGVEVMLVLPNSHLPFEKPLMTCSIYFNTDDVDAIWNRLKDQCEIVYPLEDFDYGMREFAIRDNSGYLLQFGQRTS